jgi:hypothetical protein
MARLRNIEPPSISQSVLRLITVTARTAADGSREVAAQFRDLTRRTALGTRAASVAIAGDLASVARRTAVGTGRGLRELGQEAAALRVPRSAARRPKHARRLPAATRRRRRPAGRVATS